MKRKWRFRSRGAKYGKNNSKLPLEFTNYYVNTIKGLFFKKKKKIKQFLGPGNAGRARV